MSAVVRTNPLKKKAQGKALNYQAVTRKAYVLYETAWADAWPHLDDWCKTEELLSERGRNRFVIV